MAVDVKIMVQRIITVKMAITKVTIIIEFAVT